MTSIYNYRTVQTVMVMPPKREVEIKVEGTPAERWAKYQQMAKAESRMLKNRRGTASTGGVQKKRRGPKNGVTNISRVLDYMRGRGEITASQIQEGLGDITRKQVSSSLKGLRMRGVIELTRYERGQRRNDAFWVVLEGAE